MMPPQFKLVTVVIMWVVIAVTMLGLIASGYLTEIGFFGWILVLGLIGIGGGVSSNIFESGSETGKSDASSFKKTDTSKAKRGDNLQELIGLLDEDDVYELRQRIKHRLTDQIDNGSEDDVESFDQLLSNRDRQKRR